MYLEYFGLTEPPFKITPNTGLFYPGGNRGAILDALVYAVTSGEGIVKVVGEVGSGKTMLCRMLEVRLPDSVEIVYLPNPSLTKDELLNIIAAELKVDTGEGGASTTSLIRSLQDCLIEKHANNKQVVVFVEEAQAMPLDTLEEIRLLSNLETNHYKLLQIVLFGQPELDSNLALPHMRQLKERITHSFNLQPFTPQDVGDYLEHRLRTVGYHGPNLFSPAAVKLIARASQGITRRINILADKTLLAAFSENTHNIGARHVKAAIKDCEFGKMPQPPATPSTPALRIAIGLTALLAGIAIGAGLLYQMPASLAPDETGRKQETSPAPPRNTPAMAEPVAATTAPPAQATPVQPPPPTTAPVQPDVQVQPPTAPAVNQPAASSAPAMVASTPAQTAPATLPQKIQERIEAGRRWMEDMQLPGFSLQINFIAGPNALGKTQQYLKLIQEHVDAEKIMIYRRQDKQKQDSFGFLFGRYETQEQAARALQNLSPALKNFKPQIRTRSGIVEETKK